MGILSAENNTAYTANNECKIYIIKQIDYDKIDDFKKIYVDYINSQNTSWSTKVDNINVLDNYKISLTPLLTFEQQTNPPYTEIIFNNTIDKPTFADRCWFYTPLFELRNCPLLDFSKYAYVFQINGQTKSGLSNVVSFNTTFNVNGQSTCEIIINNKDFKYNFKYFNDPKKYTLHLRPFFDTNDIIIVRYQKKNTDARQLTGSFVKQRIETYEDPYLGSENDPLTTIFTGYINDINSAFSFNSGQQTMSIICTGPSKKLTWTRLLSNNAVGSRDSGSALLPISAFTNPQTNDDNNKVTLENRDVIKNVITRTMSGVLNIPEVQKAYEDFQTSFDINANLITDSYRKNLEEKLKKAEDSNDKKLVDKYSNEINAYRSKLNSSIQTSRKTYNETIMANMNKFSVEENGMIHIKKHSFLGGNYFPKTPSVFVINGTTQPAYQYAFNNFQSIFQSDFSTVYQFIKGIADNLQFNFYDDPYGTIHFSVPDMTLLHLEKGNGPNNITQLISFSETQNTENIANIQYGQAQSVYSVDMNMINTVTKDYQSIAKYGEKMMQPFSMVGITSQTAIRYASKMRMNKYNRKALSNIRISIQGEPQIKFDKYAYIKELRKLFYIESYSHSYSAGGEFTTSINGTYTREVLADAECENSFIKIKEEDVENLSDKDKKFYKNSFARRLELATSTEDIQRTLDEITFNLSEKTLNDEIYAIYVRNWAYPQDNETLKMEIGSMYTEEKLRQCYLDGFFWAIPFDINIYDTAKSIQEEEFKKLAQFNKTQNAKKESKSKAEKASTQNKQQTPNTNEALPYCPVTYNRGDRGTNKKEFPKFPTLLDIIKVPSILNFKLEYKKNK